MINYFVFRRWVMFVAAVAACFVGLRAGVSADSDGKPSSPAVEWGSSAELPLFQSKDEPEEMIRVGCGRTDCNSADEAIGDRPRAFHQEPGRPDFSFPAAQASSD